MRHLRMKTHRTKKVNMRRSFPHIDEENTTILISFTGIRTYVADRKITIEQLRVMQRRGALFCFMEPRAVMTSEPAIFRSPFRGLRYSKKYIAAIKRAHRKMRAFVTQVERSHPASVMWAGAEDELLHEQVNRLLAAHGLSQLDATGDLCAQPSCVGCLLHAPELQGLPYDIIL
jgi:hypothetical protein